MSKPEERIWSRSLEGPGPESTPPLAFPGRRAAEWGLASLLMGSVFMLLCPLTLLVWASVISVHEKRWDKPSVNTICTALIVTEFGVLVLILVGVVFGLVGWSTARTERAPAALPVAGTMLGLMTLLFWIIILASSFITSHSLIRPHRTTPVPPSVSEDEPW